MKRLVCKNEDELADNAAAMIVREINANPGLVLGLPTGRTPLATYKKLVQAFKFGQVSFRDVITVNVDEYVGLGANDTASFTHYMHENLFRHTDIQTRNIHIPDGLADDPEVEATRYEDLIHELGGIDFLMLGVGSNGHIGFNEPGADPHAGTHVATLTRQTQLANEPDLPANFRPDHAITIGLGTICRAKRILVLAAGSRKAEPLRQLAIGGSESDWPVTILRRHPDVTVLCDEAACGTEPNIKEPKEINPRGG